MSELDSTYTTARKAVCNDSRCCEVSWVITSRRKRQGDLFAFTDLGPVLILYHGRVLSL